MLFQLWPMLMTTVDQQGNYMIPEQTGAQLGNFERGRRFICNSKDEIVHGLSPCVICVAPL